MNLESLSTLSALIIPVEKMSGATVNLPLSELMELKRKIDELETRVAKSHGPRSNEEATTMNNNLNRSRSQNGETPQNSQADQSETQTEGTALLGNNNSTFHSTESN